MSDAFSLARRSPQWSPPRAPTKDDPRYPLRSIIPLVYCSSLSGEANPPAIDSISPRRRRCEREMIARVCARARKCFQYVDLMRHLMAINSAQSRRIRARDGVLIKCPPRNLRGAVPQVARSTNYTRGRDETILIPCICSVKFQPCEKDISKIERSTRVF